MVTVHYRWHPLFGQTLRVHKRRRYRHHEAIFCELPDQTFCALPTWMFSADCAQFTLGPPLIRTEALRELRDLLTAWQTAHLCDKASLEQSPREGVHESTGEANRIGAVTSAAPRCVQGGHIERP